MHQISTPDSPPRTARADEPRRSAEQVQRDLDTKLDTILVDLDYLVDAWPSVVHLRIPGSAKRWSQRPTAPAAVQRLADDHPDLLDPQAGVPRPAPAEVQLLDILALYAGVAGEIAWDILQVRQLRRRVWFPDRSPAVDPRPWMRAAVFLLPHAHTVTRHDHPIVARTHRRLDGLVSQVQHVMGDVRDGQVLNGICPWCDGRTATGTGAMTMRIHYAEPRDVDQTLDEGDDRDALIVCHGINCTPPVHAFRDYWTGAHGVTHCPAWSRREWEWLAKQLKPVEHTNTRRTA